MNSSFKKFFPILGFGLLLTACAGWQRDCNSSIAGSFGGDWIVLQYGYDGAPINCWKLSNTAISNEQHTDGIFWQDPGGHLVHISGWYNRVQVNNNDFAGAAKAIGVNLDLCTGGKYVNPKTSQYTPSPWRYYDGNSNTDLSSAWKNPEGS